MIERREIQKRSMHQGKKILHLVSSICYVLGSVLLYPFFYVYFDGVAWFSYQFIVASLGFFILSLINLCQSQEKKDNAKGFLCKTRSYKISSLFTYFLYSIGGLLYSPLIPSIQTQKIRQSLFIAASLILITKQILAIINRKDSQVNFFKEILSLNQLDLIQHKMNLSFGLCYLIGTQLIVYSIYSYVYFVIGVYLYNIGALFMFCSYLSIYAKSDNVGSITQNNTDIVQFEELMSARSGEIYIKNEDQSKKQ